MPKGSSKEPTKKRERGSQAAVRAITTIAERSQQEPAVEITPELRAAAAAFGRIGGKIGGPARAAKLSHEHKIGIAKRASSVRRRKPE